MLALLPPLRGDALSILCELYRDISNAFLLRFLHFVVLGPVQRSILLNLLLLYYLSRLADAAVMTLDGDHLLPGLFLQIICQLLVSEPETLTQFDDVAVSLVKFLGDLALNFLQRCLAGGHLRR